MKILVRLPNWLGDIVMSSAFIRQLTKTIPGCIIDVIIKEEFFSLTGCISGIRHVYSFSKKNFKVISGSAKFGLNILKNESYYIFFTLPD
jgi:ADP-heptose:LPS heptosyltransferase